MPFALALHWSFFFFLYNLLPSLLFELLLCSPSLSLGCFIQLFIPVASLLISTLGQHLL
ncbi:hypothetical protein PPACK8108_LOCUS3630 [Phakopsora pachyrhizi]|uniref:Uncharacterized protein n=1 Tax=Phakopsora pachyrhizi TaxID=170000 RepID=A0AAV0AP23_PHAPC|nr:hypothetical protein PPACK8108_LOCUS3630 [Phakopsora pachyrhizi]